MKQQVFFKFLSVVILLVLLLPGVGASQVRREPDTQPGGDFVPGEVLVKFRPGVTPAAVSGGVETGVASLDALAREYGVTAAEPLFAGVSSSYGLEQIYKLTLPANADVWAAVAAFSADAGVEYAEPNYIYHIMGGPIDDLPESMNASSPKRADTFIFKPEWGSPHLHFQIRKGPAPVSNGSHEYAEYGVKVVSSMDNTPPLITNITSDPSDFTMIRNDIKVTATIEDPESGIDRDAVFLYYRWPDSPDFSEVSTESFGHDYAPGGNFIEIPVFGDGSGTYVVLIDACPKRPPELSIKDCHSHPGVFEYYIVAKNGAGLSTKSEPKKINIDVFPQKQEVRIVRPTIGLPTIQTQGNTFTITVASKDALPTDGSSWNVEIQKRLRNARVENERVIESETDYYLAYPLTVEGVTCDNGYWYYLTARIPDNAIEGLYDLRVEVNYRTAIQENALQVLKNFSFNPEFYHLTDLHIGFNGYPIRIDEILAGPEPNADEKSVFLNEIETINVIHPDFVILSGDLTDWGSQDNWEEFRKLLKQFEVPVYTQLGNHDYYLYKPGSAEWGANMTGDDAAVNYYLQNINSYENYSFDYGSTSHVVALDTGQLMNPFRTKALSNWQMEWLENDLTGKSNSFIFMHHPAISSVSTDSITENQNNFKELCSAKSVAAVFNGHTHRDEEHSYGGVNYYHTRLATRGDAGYRLIKVTSPAEGRYDTITFWFGGLHLFYKDPDGNLIAKKDWYKGAWSTLIAEIANHQNYSFTDMFLKFVMPAGEYEVSGGIPVAKITYGDKSLYYVTTDVEAGETKSVTLIPLYNTLYNTPFITDGQLTNYNSMTRDQIDQFLEKHNSYFRQPIQDVDGQTFDPAEVIAQASTQYKINPQVILTTLQKESSGVTRSTRPSDTQMRYLMGCSWGDTARDQLRCAAERFRTYHNQLTDTGSTVSGWQVGVPKTTQDGVTVTPATKAVAGQFTYTPYAGVHWGGNLPSVGGVYLFYYYWNEYGFATWPDDPYFTYQWGLHNTGQAGGKEDADIDAPEAWGITIGTADVMVAVIDTGVDYKHEDLDDGRVRKDIDKDYVNNDDDAIDDNGHGTHVAGIIAAETNNGVGVAGVMWQAQILPLKVLDSRGSGTADAVASAIRYAADQGADVIINMSLGGSNCSQTIADAVNYAYFDKGLVIVAAAGNEGGSISYPAKLAPVIAVGATDRNDHKADFSNFGEELDVVAPGVDIFSTVPNNGYDALSGTSMASPHVAGVAGLLLAQRPDLSNGQVREILRQSADDLGDSGFDHYYGYGRLNAYQALQMDTPDEPPPPERAGCGGDVWLDNTGLSAEPDARALASTLRAVRDKVFTQDPGRRWTRIYYKHQFEVEWLLLSDSQVRADALAGFRAFYPVFRAGLDDDKAGPPVLLTPELIEAARRPLMGVAERGSPAVHDVIIREWNKVDPYRFVGWNVLEVWEQLRREEQPNQVYLPLILRH